MNTDPSPGGNNGSAIRTSGHKSGKFRELFNLNSALKIKTIDRVSVPVVSNFNDRLNDHIKQELRPLKQFTAPNGAPDEQITRSDSPFEVIRATNNTDESQQEP